MQNLTSQSYINNRKIINIKSEILCRQAEDYFFYFNKVNAAYKKLNEAVKLSPYHLKSISFLADIAFIKGYTKKALNLYLRAEQMCSSVRILASIANCYCCLNEYKKAVQYCNKAIDEIKEEDFYLYPQIAEIKIHSLIAQKQYKQAYKCFIKIKNILDKNSLKNIYNINYELLNEKIKLQERLDKVHLQIVGK